MSVKHVAFGGSHFPLHYPDIGIAGHDGTGRCWERRPEAGGLGSLSFGRGGGARAFCGVGGGGFGAGGPDSSFLAGGQEDRISFGCGGARAFCGVGGGGFGAGGPDSSFLVGGQEVRASSQRTRCYGSRLGALVRGAWEPAIASSSILG